jgi:choline kinase
MAGSGSRLRTRGNELPKPLTPVAGRPLVSYTIDLLVRNGIKVINAIVGYQSSSLISGLEPLIPPEVKLRIVHNADWKKQNGISVLAAASAVSGPFLLTMSDHLIDDDVVQALLRQARSSSINLAVDRKIDSVFDLADAMKVQTCGEQILAIGKELPEFNAIDTGLFACDRNVFDYFERAKVNGDCSLSDGVRLMATDGKARAIDIGEAWWQDVDTPEMLAHAEKHLRARSGRSEIASIGASTPGRNRREN